LPGDPGGIGGEGVLRTHGRTAEAQAVIFAAHKTGITYYDSGHVYADSERYLGSIYGMDQAIRRNVFQASKSASRDYRGAMADLESTLKRLKTDYLDLWQIHDVRTEEDLERISAPEGALKAFKNAKASGRVKYIGVTGDSGDTLLGIRGTLYLSFGFGPGF
jgi:aryl-alcohol dehydrogenase-like predicted oxidoreductase